MSRLQQHNHFLSLLLDTNRKQRKALVNSAEPEQLLALSEVLFNAWFNLSDFPEDVRKLVKRNRQFMKKFSKQKTARSARRAYFIKHSRSLFQLLDVLRPHLTTRLNDYGGSRNGDSTPGEV